MYSLIVGGLKFTPNDFWNLTLVEAELILKGDKERQEMKFMMQVYSVMNGIGSVLGGKGFKFINPFNKAKDKENLPKKKTREELLQDLEDIKKAFDR